MSTKHKHLHVIGIGGIGVSALARYYHHIGYTVSGSDGSDSPLLDSLRSEGFQIDIGHDTENLPPYSDLVIYSEAIITKPDLTPEQQIYSNPELARARDLGIRHISYPIALGEVFNSKNGIAITGSHGKSTTTAMTGLLLAQEIENRRQKTEDRQAPGASVLVGTQVPQLGNSNFHFEDSPNFVIEACEYKRSFLQYRPYITVITNIDLDHLDYYKNLEDYISAFQSLVDQTSGYVIISADDENSKKLRIPEEKKLVVGKRVVERSSESPPDKGELEGVTQKEIPQSIIPPSLPFSGEGGSHKNKTPIITYYPRVEEDCCGKKKIYYVEKTLDIPEMHLQVPGEHLLQDAYLAYTVGRLLGMEDATIVSRLESYRGSWRRSEIVKTTIHGNILMSDYGHHPNEIRPTLKAIHEKYPDKKLLVVFQPHQYSRTRELLQEFATSFSYASELIIPNIYFSRDKKEDVEWMTTERLIEAIQRAEKVASSPPDTGGRGVGSVINGEGLENTLILIRKYDLENPDSSVILLLGAGDVDMLRYEIG